MLKISYLLILLSGALLSCGDIDDDKDKTIIEETAPKVVVYQNQTDRNHFLQIGLKASSQERGLKIKKIPLENVDQACKRLEEFDPKFVYVGSMLVSSKATCMVEGDVIKEIKGAPKPPKDHFSFSFLTKTDTDFYFILNGRDFLDGEAGYIVVKKVANDGTHQSYHLVADDLPNFSGAISLSQDKTKVYLTEYIFDSGNNIYELSVEAVMAGVASPVSFASLVTKKLNLDPFEGLTGSMVNNSSQFLYVANPKYGDSYFLHYSLPQITPPLSLNQMQKSCVEIEESCAIFGISEDYESIDQNWLKACESNEEVTYSAFSFHLDQKTC